MSHSDDDHHDGGHQPAPRELSHPLLWAAGLIGSAAVLAWLFFSQIEAGRAHARGAPKIVLKQTAAPIDHQALLADKSQAVLDAGELLYGKNCASCHGATGDTNPTGLAVVPRNFKTEAFKTPLGNGPYAFYHVLSEGYGASMPPFRNLTPAERYAVVHFVRETMMKGNPALLAKDLPATVAKIPAPGAAGGEEKPVDPRAIAPPALVPLLMAAHAQQDALHRAQIDAWLARAQEGAPAEVVPSLSRIAALAKTQPGQVDRLFAAAQARDDNAFAAVLVADAGAGPADPHLTLLPATSVQALFARLVAAVGAPQ